jgi:hypothetical protein
MRPGRDLERCRRDRRGQGRRDLAELAVRLGGRPLDERDRPDELGGDIGAADVEVVERPLRLRAPQRRPGDANFAEAVLFDAILVAHG